MMKRSNGARLCLCSIPPSARGFSLPLWATRGGLAKRCEGARCVEVRPKSEEVDVKMADDVGELGSRISSARERVAQAEREGGNSVVVVERRRSSGSARACLEASERKFQLEGVVEWEIHAVARVDPCLQQQRSLLDRRVECGGGEQVGVKFRERIERVEPAEHAPAIIRVKEVEMIREQHGRDLQPEYNCAQLIIIQG